MIAALTNHLWQSTVFVVAAALVAMALRKNGAHVRHRVWVVASLKFLVPFSVLMSLGSALPSPTPAATGAATPAVQTVPDLSVTVDRIAQPFTSEVFFSSVPETSQSSTDWTTTVLVGAWACGFGAVALMRLRGWRRIRAAVRASAPVELASPVPVRSSPGLLEPGVVGLWRPMLLVPAGIEQHLTPPQLNAVLAHELCHVQRRDNLTSAIHMFVEAAFWFHPLVWFVGARLVDERERACDEHVLRVCGEPRVYAESILNVCKLYVESPIACVSGVSGADLKKRIAAIISNRVGLQLNFARKAALSLAAMLAVLLPVLVGVLIAPLRAQSAQNVGAAQSPKFDVVSIKPCEPAPPTGGRTLSQFSVQLSPGYAHWNCVTVAVLIVEAYTGSARNNENGLFTNENPLLNNLIFGNDSDLNLVKGLPDWARSDKFEIEARGPVVPKYGTAFQGDLPQEVRLMIRSMLEDRFQLKLRRATEERPVYALSVAPGGLKLGPAGPTKCWVRSSKQSTPPPGSEDVRPCGSAKGGDPGGNHFTEYTNFSLAGLALDLSKFMDRYVLDKTGVDGRFDFRLTFAVDDHTPKLLEERAREEAIFAKFGNPVVARQEATAPNIFKALELLGLRLEPVKGPQEFLVTDSVQRPKPNDAAADALQPMPRASGKAGR